MTQTEGSECNCSPRCTPKSRFVNGIEFRISTWCNTPQPWNPTGSWLKAPENMQKIKAGIRKVSDLNALEAILNNPSPSTQGKPCRTFWGSHGCSLNEGHDGVWHVCGDADDPCMAVANWGDESLIAWHIDGPRDEWEPWGLYWEWYA